MAGLSAAITQKARELLADLGLENDERDMLEKVCSLVEARATRLTQFDKTREHI
jgi:hypothetical protein